MGTFYILCAGSVDIIKDGDTVGNVAANADNMTAHYFGEDALYDSERRGATVKVTSPTANALELDRNSIEKTMGPLRQVIERNRTSGQSPHAQDDNNDVHEDRVVSEFVVNLTKGGATLGLDLITDASALFVERVAPIGVIADYNSTTSKAKIIESGDFILICNDIARDSDAMLRSLQADNNIELKVRKGEEATLEIPKSGKIGLKLLEDERKEYLFISVILYGSILGFNAKVPYDRQVKALSRITAVNG